MVTTEEAAITAADWATADVAAIIEYLSGLLRQHIPGCEPLLEPSTSRSFRVGGILLWDGFEGESQKTRQRRFWSVLENNLSEEQMERITGVLTFTPWEWKVMQDNAE